MSGRLERPSNAWPVDGLLTCPAADGGSRGDCGPHGGLERLWQDDDVAPGPPEVVTGVKRGESAKHQCQHHNDRERYDTGKGK